MLPWALLAVGVVALGAIVGLLLSQRPRTTSFYSDDASIRVRVDEAARRDVLWQPPVKLSETLNTTEEDYEPRLSWDENTLYLVRGKAAGERGAGDADIHVSRRTPAGWTQAEPLFAVNSEFDDLGPEPSRDGSALYFYSNRPGGSGGYDIWVSRVADGEWQSPANLGPAVNSAFNDYGPALSPDQAMLYFASNRPLPQDPAQPNPDAWPATVREDLYRRTYDLYAASLTERGPEPARPLTALNTPFNEGAACVSPGGDFLYFSSDRPGGHGGFDLYRARFVRGDLRPPENLGAAINSVANELDPALAALGFGLMFSSDRPIVPAAPDRPNDYNLYYSASRDVFIESEALSPPGIDWSALWRRVLPNLIWAALALLAFLLLLAIFRDWQRRRLSLLARCLLASLAAHALLMFLTTFWRVTSTVVGAMRGDGGGEIRVALGPGGGGAESLERQLLGAITDVPTPDAVLAAAAPLESPLEPQPVAIDAAFAAARSVITSDPAPLAFSARDTSPPLPELRPTPAAQALTDAPVALNMPSDAVRMSASEAEVAPSPSQSGASVERLNAPIDVSPDSTPATIALPASRIDSNSAAGLAAATTVRAADALPAAPSGLTQPRDFPALPERGVSVAVPRDAPPQDGTATGGVEQEPSASVRALPGSGAPADAARTPSAGSDGAEATFASVAPARSSALADDAVSFATVAIPTRGARAENGVPLVASSQAVVDASSLSLPNLKLPSAPGAAGGTTADSEPAARAPMAAAPGASAVRAGFEPVGNVNPTPVINLPSPSRSGTNGGSLAATSAAPRDAGLALPISNPGRPQGGDSALRTVGALDLSPAAIRLPGETAAATPPDTLAEGGGARQGGNPRVDSAVDRALAWLVRHQSADGHWDGDAFDDGCGECDGTTPHLVDVTLTGLSTLALLGAGHSPAQDGPYRDNLVRAVAWLRARQNESGDLRAGETMYSHAIATLALAETLAVTKDPSLEEPLRRAVDAIVRAPNLLPGTQYENNIAPSGEAEREPDADEPSHARRRGVAGPRRGATSDADTAVLGWQVMALHSARLAGVDVPPEPLAEAQRWLARVEDREAPGAYAFKPGQPPSDAMTAEGLLIQLMLGAPRDDARTLGSIDLISRFPPRWKPEPNAYYWFFATFALFHVKGDPWVCWNEQLIQELIANQEKGGRRDGSWPAAGRSAAAGGRVYQTALCTLMLESGRKLLPMLAAVKDDAGGGVLRGQVTSTVGDRPLPGALVRADIAGGVPVAAYAGPDGRYELFFPVMPPHFALTASYPGYLPKSENIASAALQRGATQDFALEPRARDRIVLEPVPDVHHLGNDRFEGAINSQFQKMSEGQLYRETFDLPEGPPPPSARLTLMTRGVQCPHPVRINGEQVGTLRNSPPDGSFGRLTLRFDGSVLLPGRNVIEIQGISCTGDLDDFEFVNVQIQIEE